MVTWLCRGRGAGLRVPGHPRVLMSPGGCQVLTPFLENRVFIPGTKDSQTQGDAWGQKRLHLLLPQ